MAGLSHEKVGHTGQGLWHHKGWQLPAYIQHVANDLIESGHSESRAIEMAVGIVKNWAHGHDGHGHTVHPDTQAKAAAAIAEWEALKAAASKSKSRSDSMSERAEMTSASINDLPDSAFAYIEPGGKKDSSGKTVPRSLRHFPIHDAAHVRNALARAPQSPFGEKAMPKIRAAAKKFGVEVSDDSSSSRTEMYTRSFPLDNIEVARSGDGRTVEAYAAVFNTPTMVRDEDGEYEEVIDPGAFNRTIDHARRSGRGIPVLFNHGKTLYGTPSERYSVPIGVADANEIRFDSKGMFTRARYHKTQAADEVLEAIRDGSITAYSFQGAFMRSDPMRPRGGYRRSPGGVTTVRRTEATVKEFGPGTFAYYPEAAIVGMRAEQAALLLGTLPASERERLAQILSFGTPYVDPPEPGTPSDEGLAADDPPRLGHSTRSYKQELQNAYARFLIEQGSK
jgi:HK97 family phage prohead protease